MTALSPLSTVVPEALIPEFGACAALTDCDMTSLLAALGNLDDIAWSIGQHPQGSPPIESALARYLLRDQAARRELHAATASSLTRYMDNSDRGLDRMAKRSRIDPDVTDALINPFVRLDLDTLVRIARMGSGDPLLQLRTREVFTSRDVRGTALQYPPPAVVPARAQAICGTYSSCRAPADLAKAVWLLVAVINAHPFRDGNGRLARTLFAAALVRCGITRSPLFALGPLQHASRGAFEIARRRVPVQGRWQPLIDLLALYAGYLAKHMPHLIAADDEKAGQMQFDLISNQAKETDHA
jgi:Fic/DOC family